MTTTGLPELPEGQVWWVGKRYNYYDHTDYVVQIKFHVKRRFRSARYSDYGPDGKEAYCVVPGFLTAKNIQTAANQLLETLEERKATRNLTGFYPPNTLDVQDD